MKYLERNIPEGYHLRVVHLHDGNSWEYTRRPVASKVHGTGRKYVTIATIIDANNETLAEGIASCSAEDNPCRQIGREVAVGRAMKELFERGRGPDPRHGEQSEP